jgi:hypothetical protein
LFYQNTVHSFKAANVTFFFTLVLKVTNGKTDIGTNDRIVNAPIVTPLSCYLKKLAKIYTYGGHFENGNHIDFRE